MELPIFDGAVWTSTDATDWARVEDPDGLFSGPGISTAFDAAVTDGTTAWAFGVDQGNMVDALAVWTTGDGSNWQRVEITGDGISTSQDLVVADAALSPMGMVVVGSEFGDAGRFPAAWFSPDGIVWERVDPLVAGEGELMSVAAMDHGFVVVGNSREDHTTRPLILLSGDGRSWSQDTGGPAVVEGAAGLTTVAAHQDVLIVGGQIIYFDDSRDLVMWSGSVGPSGA